jgi:eukaryotic-like serine/threonine-protein kinase
VPPGYSLGIVPEAVRPSLTPTPWLAGTIIKERYRLEGLLRRGGMGSVWRAEHLELKSPVAIKVLDADIARDRVMVQRFLREAQAAAALRSPNVVQILDYGVDDERAFIAMELLEGETLSERIARRGRMPPEELAGLLADVLRAMHKAHEAGIVHRDLKPDNIFICRDEPEFAKVLDFGVAKVKKGALADMTATGTQTGLMLGTPYYMSPEQAQAKVIDGRTDLWSIAVIAFEGLLGRRPFVAESLGDLVLAICTTPTPIPSRVGPVPPGFDEWFVRGTQRDPARRFQSAREMAEELDRVLRPNAAPGIKRFLTSPGPSGPPMVAPVITPVSSRMNASAAPGATDLQLTTGQRSAVTREPSLPSAPRSSSAGLIALLAVGALILVAVLVFAFGGGARAIREAEVGAERSPVTHNAALALPSAAERPLAAAPLRPVPAAPSAAPVVPAPR